MGTYKKRAGDICLSEIRLTLQTFFDTILFTWPVRLMVRTLPSQGRNTGSIPVRATRKKFAYHGEFFVSKLG